jgi:uncharacterized membrane protein
MTSLVVMTYDDMDEAERVRDDISKGEHQGYMSLDDSAVIVKDQEGKVHVKNQVDRGVKVGAVGGGLLGLLIGVFFFPVGAVVLGALGGALIGKFADMGVDKKFINEVSDSLKPGSSALFIIIRNAEPAYAIGVLEKYKGTVYQTNLPTELEDELRKEMAKNNG